MKEYKQVKFRLSSWRKLRRQFYGRLNETFSDYIERIEMYLKNVAPYFKGKQYKK